MELRATEARTYLDAFVLIRRLCPCPPPKILRQFGRGTVLSLSGASRHTLRHVEKSPREGPSVEQQPLRCWCRCGTVRRCRVVVTRPAGGTRISPRVLGVDCLRRVHGAAFLCRHVPARQRAWRMGDVVRPAKVPLGIDSAEFLLQHCPDVRRRAMAPATLLASGHCVAGRRGWHG